MTCFAFTYRIVPDGDQRRAEFDTLTPALGFRHGVKHWACDVSEIETLDRAPYPWFRPGPGAPVEYAMPIAPRYVPDDEEDDESDDEA